MRLRQDPGNTTLYLPGEELTRTTSTGNITGTRYYTHNGTTVAVRIGNSNVDYLYSDPHGTTQTALPATATGVANPIRRYFDPYGNPLGTPSAAWPDQHSYLNKPSDSTTALDDLGARQYDPTTGRFIQTDPLLGPGNPQQSNGYNYANNNPALSSDPSGAMLQNPSDISGPAITDTNCGCTSTSHTAFSGINNEQAQPSQSSDPLANALEALTAGGEAGHPLAPGSVVSPTLIGVGSGTYVFPPNNLEAGNQTQGCGAGLNYTCDAAYWGAYCATFGQATQDCNTMPYGDAHRYAGINLEFALPAAGAGSGSPAQLVEGRESEAQQLADLGIIKNTDVWRPSVEQLDSSAFRVIVGEAKFTPGGQPVGVITDATGLEIKFGSSTLSSTYQLRLMTFRALAEPEPLTLLTTRPVAPAFLDWLTRWGVTVGEP